MKNHGLDIAIGIALIGGLLLIGLVPVEDAWEKHLELRTQVGEDVFLARP